MARQTLLKNYLRADPNPASWLPLSSRSEQDQVWLINFGKRMVGKVKGFRRGLEWRLAWFVVGRKRVPESLRGRAAHI